jgi:hypothetical protein
MSSMTISCIVFACIFGGALFGMMLRALLPEKHLSAESKDLVKLGMGLIFGLFAPPNPTVFVTLLVCALAVSSAIFLILELDRPFDGMIHVSSAPLRNTLTQLGR